MRSRLPMGIAVLMTIVAGGTQVAAALEPSRLAAITARQQLRDEVCIAKADGQISRLERYLILADAKRILKPEEYAGFKESLDRLSPPKLTTVKYYVKTAQKKSPPLAHSSPASTGVTEIIVRDPIASTGGAR